jgi:hypothetical protein
MYTACTIRLSVVIEDTSFLMAIPRVFLFIAQAAWLATFLGLIHHLLTLHRTNKT